MLRGLMVRMIASAKYVKRKCSGVRMQGKEVGSRAVMRGADARGGSPYGSVCMAVIGAYVAEEIIGDALACGLMSSAMIMREQ